MSPTPVEGGATEGEATTKEDQRPAVGDDGPSDDDQALGEDGPVSAQVVEKTDPNQQQLLEGAPTEEQGQPDRYGSAKGAFDAALEKGAVKARVIAKEVLARVRKNIGYY